MKILIFGSTGSIGLDLVDFFSNEHKVYATYRNKNYIPNKKINKNIRWIQLDLSKKINLKVNPDIIINCVATHQFSKKCSPKDYIDSNVIAFNNIINFSAKKRIKLFINLSTVAIYGNINVQILNEQSPINEQDILGISKNVGENILFTHSMNYLNLRLPGVLTKKFTKTRPWLNSIIDKIIKNQDFIIYNPNSKFNNLVDTYELFNFINSLIKKNKIYRSTYLLSATRAMKLNNLLNYIINFFHSNSKFKIRKTNNISFTISTKKIQNELNYYPSTSKKIIKRYLKDFYNNE